MGALILELRDVTLSFGANPPLLTRIDLAVHSRADAVGDFVVIEGPSGSGKSSLLRLLNRLNEPAQGQLFVNGAPSRTEPVPALRRRVVLLQQTPVILADTVKANLCFGDRFSPDPPATDEESLRQCLDQVDLHHIGLEDAAEPLSVGQRQRLALARALRVRPQILLADEPTSALDDASRHVVLRRLEALCVDEGLGIVLVTHQRFTPGRVTPRRLRLAAGRLEEI